MGRMDYLAMKTDPVADDLIASDINDLKLAAKKLINDATKLGGLGFGTSFLKWVASFSAIYLLILDRTNWRTNMLTSLLGRGWKMDCIHCSCSKAVLPPTLSRLSGDARIIDSSAGRGSKLLRGNLEEQLGRRSDMPPHRMLPTTRAHPSLGWIPEFLHSEPWNIKHSWHHPSDSLPRLVLGAPLDLATHSVVHCSSVGSSAKLETKTSIFSNVLVMISNVHYQSVQPSSKSRWDY
ncbi:hypothetical protein PTKIN_Ptkin08bG0174600 [Pterospermum kingtungense]